MNHLNCKPVTSPFCQGLGYSTTASPTGVAGYSLQQIGQLVETACSPHIAILMCRVAVPECGSEDVNRMKPCRALCQKVKTDCESTFKARRLSWPVRLRCESSHIELSINVSVCFKPTPESDPLWTVPT
uniref:FZ domain-containing protein n=1 Tax=Labrus bergylta TaxID=56723 RepID=A0A3Q3GLZ2_9LABR